MSPQDEQAQQGQTFEPTQGGLRPAQPAAGKGERPQRILPGDCLPSSADDAAGQDGKRAESALREREERFRRLCEASFEGIAIHSKGKILDANPALARMFGYELSEVIGMPALDFAAPKSRDLVLQKMRSGDEEAFEAVGLRKDGSTFRGELRGKTIPYDGRIVGVAAIRDITERKRAEEALRESEGRLAIILESVQTGIVIVDAETHVITDANSAAVKLIGAPKEEIIGSVCHRYICPADEGRCPITDLGQTDDNSERVLLRAGGESCPIIKTVVTVNIGGRKHLLESFADITERKRAEEALEESERRYRLLAENATDIIWTRDMNLRPTYISPSVTSILGYSVEEAMAQTIDEVLTPASVALARKALAEELAMEEMEQKDLSRSRTLELEQYCRDGSTVWAEVRMTFLRDEHNRAVGILGVSRDITERKRAEEALQKAREGLESRVERQVQRGNAYGLTFRELTVLHLVAAGESDKEIATVLGISTLTASKHVANILHKMAAACRTEAGVRAIREELLD